MFPALKKEDLLIKRHFDEKISMGDTFNKSKNAALVSAELFTNLRDFSDIQINKNFFPLKRLNVKVSQQTQRKWLLAFRDLNKWYQNQLRRSKNYEEANHKGTKIKSSQKSEAALPGIQYGRL